MSLDESIKKIVEAEGLKLYDIERTTELDRHFFRVYITGSEVTLGRCEKISKLVSPLLDVEEPMHGKYYFEVSSPGIERNLKKLEHYQSSIGEMVKLKTYDGKVKGTLIGVENNSIVVQTEEEKKTIKLEDIKTARTYIEW